MADITIQAGEVRITVSGRTALILVALAAEQKKINEVRQGSVRVVWNGRRVGPMTLEKIME